jgi:DNA primase
MISREDIDLVKSKTDIGELVIRLGVTLKSAGAGSFKGLCPFHDEKSPSFNVRPHNGTYMCFGCGKGGDVFSFLQEKEGMTFTESIMYLADMHGIPITEDNTDEPAGPSRKRVLEALQKTAQYYYEQYTELPDSHPAKVQLFDRNLQHFAEESGIGYAPEGWSHVKDLLTSNGFSEEEIMATGLMSKSDNNRTYDLFRGRLTWSIADISGKVIGFGARKIFEEDKGPKYINSPQTIVYDKSRVLYGLNQARAEAAKSKQLIVVEGYTDVMAYRAAGIMNVVASCGTAFGDPHAQIARRIIGEDGQMIFSFDGDQAGIKAARKVFELKTPIHSTSWVAISDQGDPCDIRLKSGDEALGAMLENRLSLTEFVLRNELSKHNVTTAEGRATFLQAVGPLLANITDYSLKDDYIRKVTLWSGATLSVVRDIVGRYRPGSSDSNDDMPLPPEPEENYESTSVVRQKIVLALCLQYPVVASTVVTEDLFDDFFDDILQPTSMEVISLTQADPHYLETMPADEFSDPESVRRLLHHQFPIIDRLKDAGQINAYVQRSLISTIKNIKALKRKQRAAQLRVSINESYQDSGSEDTSVLSDIQQWQDALRADR